MAKKFKQQLNKDEKQDEEIQELKQTVKNLQARGGVKSKGKIPVLRGQQDAAQRIQELQEKQDALKQRMDEMRKNTEARISKFKEEPRKRDEEEEETEIPKWSFRNLKVGTRLVLGFLIIVLVLGIVGYISIKQSLKIRETIYPVLEEHIPHLFLEDEIKDHIHHEMMAIDHFIHNYWIEGGIGVVATEHKDFYFENKEHVKEDFQKYLVTADEEEKPLAEAAQKGLKKLEVKIEQTFILLDKSDADAKIISDEVEEIHELMEAEHELVDGMIGHEKEHIEEVHPIIAGLISEMTRLLVILVIGVILLVLILSYFLSKSIAMPIQKLSAVTKKITKGDLAKRAEVSSRDEVGELADSFNKMTNSLESTLNEVQAKNEELQTFNEELQTSQEELETMNEEMQQSNEELEMTTQQLEEAQALLKGEKVDLEKIVAQRTKELEEAKAQLETRVNHQSTELLEKNRQLEAKIAELEKFTEATVGREEEIIKLKEKIKELGGTA